MTQLITTPRLKYAERHALLLKAAKECAIEFGYRSVTREQIATRGGVSDGLVSRMLGDMEIIKSDILKNACVDIELKIIVEGVLRGDRQARKVAKVHREDIIKMLFK